MLNNWYLKALDTIYDEFIEKLNKIKLKKEVFLKKNKD